MSSESLETSVRADHVGPGLVSVFVKQVFCWSIRIVAALTIIGSLVRWTVKDGLQATEFLFYATPLPLLVLGAVTSILFACRARRRWLVCCWSILLAVLAVSWIQQDWGRHASLTNTFSSEDSQEVRVLFWNVARRQDLTAAVQEIRRQAPDVVGLVEVEGDVSAWKQFWREQLPEYDCSALGGLMYVLAKGTSGATTVHKLGGGSEARQLSVNLHGDDFEIVLVDINADPLRTRGPALHKLASVVNPLAGKRLLVMGDFNTPADSVHLYDLRRHHQLVFEQVGTGYGPTWPIPLPLMQLDQIWINFEVQPMESRQHWTWASDHAAVSARIRPAH